MLAQLYLFRVLPKPIEWNQLNWGMELESELESLNSKKCPKSDSGIDSIAGIINL